MGESIIIHLNYMSHGKKSFDTSYYKRFFIKYDKAELDLYYRWHWGWANFLDRFLDLKDGRGRKALEIGSSIGSFVAVLQERGFKVVGSDVSGFIVSKAKKHFKNIDFMKINIEKGIPLAEKFDYIFAFEVVEHLRDVRKSFKNIQKSLSKDGVFVFSTPFPTTRSLSDPTHINVHESSYWKKLGKSLGFKKINYTYATFAPLLYRFSKYLSFGVPVRTDLPYVNSTAIYFFKK